MFFFEKPDYKPGLLLKKKPKVQWTSNNNKETMSSGGELSQTRALLNPFGFFDIASATQLQERLEWVNAKDWKTKTWLQMSSMTTP